MSRFARFATAAILAASLAPFAAPTAAQARPGGSVSSAPAETLVAIPGASLVQYHGRAAERAAAIAAYSLSSSAPEYAAASDDGFEG